MSETIEMTDDRPKQIRMLYEELLQRRPGKEEFEAWCERVKDKRLSFEDLFKIFVNSKEYQNRKKILPGHKPGHYYSPVVDTKELLEYFKPDRSVAPSELAGLNLSDEELVAKFDELSEHIGHHRFAYEPTPAQRYYTKNDMFPLGDAIILDAIIAKHRPQRIVEIGSGFSTAVMLDAIERCGLQTRITCVEPYADRLRSLLRPADRERVSIIEAKVQTTDPSLLDDLRDGDILFIDSSHVVKTGSDVCFEMFEMLPRLRKGVLVHFHDIFYPFEYRDDWIFHKRYSWNEAYMLRSFLMYNDRFRVEHFNHYMGRHHRPKLDAAYGAAVESVGGGLWLRAL